MHCFIYLSSLVLLVQQTIGLPTQERNSCHPRADGSQDGWWCGTKPCDCVVKEVNHNHTQIVAVATRTAATETAVIKLSVNGIASKTLVPDLRQHNAPSQWWCGTRPCGSTSSSMRVKKRQSDNHASNNERTAAAASTQKTPGWVCGHSICPPLPKEINQRSINMTSTTNSTTPDGPAHRWWCGTHICRSRMKTVRNLRTDPTASGASGSL